MLAAHFRALCELIDLERGTIVAPTASLRLCNTEVPFDPAKTASESGALTEYLRTRPGAVRSMHPFVSYTALGRDAQAVCGQVARHSFGPETPEARMVELGGIDLCIGLPPRFCSSLVHCVEHVMGVPYRYTKEFMHPVVRGSKVVIEPFYMLVWYRQCNITRNKNQKIYQSFFEQGGKVLEHPLGRGKVYSMSMTDFYQKTIKTFSRDIYCWLDAPPEDRPYRI